MDRFRCQEEPTFVISGTILDEDAAAVAFVALTGATLTALRPGHV